MRAVVEALREFPIQVLSTPHGTAALATCAQCGNGVDYLVGEHDRVETTGMCVEWLREHQCYCDHIQSWGSRECILCGQSLL